MSSDWQETTLGQFAPFSYGKSLPERDRVVGQYPVLSSAGFTGWHNTPLVKSSGIVIGRKGTVGSVTLSKSAFWVIDTAFFIEDKPEIRNLYFTYYLLKTLGLPSMNSDSAVPGLNRDNAHSLSICVPSIEIQREIASMLRILDDRITLLRETNATLEAIAQAMFKSWFVDFDPVHAKQQGRAPEGMDEVTTALFPDSFEESELGLVPRGWEVKTIGDVCDFQNGYAFKSNEMTKSTENTYKIFKMGNIKKGGGLNRAGTKDYFEIAKSKNLDRYLVKKGDLLMCMTDMKNNVALLGHTALMDVDDQFLLNQRVGMLRSRDVEIANFPFLYILTNSGFFIEDLRMRANSGVQVNLSTNEIKNTKFLLPTKEIHQKFNEIAEAIQEKIFLLELEQDNLSEIRDTLLPRLISGQLRLPEAEAILEEVTA